MLDTCAEHFSKPCICTSEREVQQVFQPKGLDLTLACGVGFQHHHSGPASRSSFGFPQDLGSIKGCRCQDELDLCLSSGYSPLHPPACTSVLLFPLNLAQTPSAKPVSPSLFIFTSSDKLCHCFFLILFSSLFETEPVT